MTVISLNTITFENENGSSKDQVKFSLVTQGATGLTAAQVATLWGVFFNQHVATHGLGEYLATCVSRTVPGAAAAYDITAHLDGSSHGSPYVTGSYTLPASLGDSRGNQLCAVLNHHSGAYATTPNNGPSGPIPTPEQAQDYGAPATHTGVTKPKQRQAGRMFLGPLSSTAIGVDGDANPQFTDTFMADAAAHLSFFNGNISADIGQDWKGWSRRDAAVWFVTGGWVDRGVKTRRVKGHNPNTRTNWP